MTVLALLIIGVIVELYVFVQVTHVIGVLDAIGLLILTSLAGAWLARHEGFIVIQRVRDRLDRGEIPGREMTDGLLILIGGVLLLIPGFVSDVVGLVFLFPPTRALLRVWLARRFTLQVFGGRSGRGGPPDTSAGGGDVIDI